MPYDFTAPPLHTAKKQISLPKDQRYTQRRMRIANLDYLCQDGRLNAKIYFGAAGRCTKTSAADILNCESHISHLQQQCNFVSTKKAGCHSSFAQKSVLDANCQFILRVAASLAMKQKTGVLRCCRFAEFSSHCY